jgi:hypothetical protein
MNELTSKLNGEIQNFTLIQFLAIIFGSLLSLYFYSQASKTSPQLYLTTALAIILTLGIAGVSQFHIHRNGSYLEKSESVSSEVRKYEEDKQGHWTTWIVTPLAIILSLGILLPVARSSIQNYQAHYEAWWFSIVMYGLLATAALLYAFSAQLGRWGWSKL